MRFLAASRTVSVHPHVRGDGFGESQLGPRAGGSPPRAWGRLRLVEPNHQQQRFTPTCVGTASNSRVCACSRTVHPHVRGDGVSSGRMSRASSGSPPRAWGRPRGPHREGRAGRFTPTCVGTASCSRSAGTVVAVHPHVRGDGEYTCPWAERGDGSPPRAWGRPQGPRGSQHSLLGSPPRAWGRPRGGGGRGLSRRFTPTCVGTAGAPQSQYNDSPVHPHVRGDGKQARDARARAGGSPPRAWGRLCGLAKRQAAPRFTPTCVGTAACCSLSANCGTVHPHVRGDGPTYTPLTDKGRGSPPRAWGRRPYRPHRAEERRFTPTCVGTASSSGRTPDATAVHPHVRGDGFCEIATDVLPNGSPPRAWGRHYQSSPPRIAARFTPTCVGTAPVTGRKREPTTVHPHVRGDGRRQRGRLARGFGSPPRAWGRPEARRATPARVRFTPTCVGTAATRPGAALPFPVHPHVRGDGGLPVGVDGPAVGSPPRAWGRPSAKGSWTSDARFTPTCVGTATSSA